MNQYPNVTIGGNSYNEAKVSVPRSTIQGDLDELHNCIAVLRERLADLGQRLQPVMRPISTGQTQGAIPAPSDRCEIEARVQEAIAALRALSVNVTDAMGQLAI